MDSRLLFTPEDRERGAPEAEMAKALAEGRAENERWHLRKDGSRFWGSGLLLPLRGAAAGGFLKVMRDQTARREGDERQGLLIRELAHRVKNSLALIMAMARQTRLRAADLDEFLGTFEGRLQALATVHDLLSEAGWRSTPLAALIRAALAPHEGRVRLGRWPTCGSSRRRRKTWCWRCTSWQRTRPSTARSRLRKGLLPLRRRFGRRARAELARGGRSAGGRAEDRGFGTTLLERVVAHQHKGRVQLDWRSVGLACTIRLPLAEVVDAATAQNPIGRRATRDPILGLGFGCRADWRRGIARDASTSQRLGRLLLDLPRGFGRAEALPRLDLDPARLHLLGHLAHQLDRQQPISDAGTRHLDVVGELEAALERAGGDAAVQVLLRVPVGLLLAAHDQQVGLRREIQLVRPQARDGHGDAVLILACLLDVVRRPVVDRLHARGVLEQIEDPVETDARPEQGGKS